MSNQPFCNLIHYVVKALGDVDYPITKSELIKLVGDKEVLVDWNETRTMKELIEPIKIDKFESAASFFCALGAVL
jgi:hypothetical protein